MYRISGHKAEGNKHAYRSQKQQRLAPESVDEGDGDERVTILVIPVIIVISSEFSFGKTDDSPKRAAVIKMTLMPTNCWNMDSAMPIQTIGKTPSAR